MEKYVYPVLALYLLLSASGLLLMKSGSSDLVLNIQNNIVNLSVSAKMIIGMIFYIFSFFLFIVIIPKFNLSYIYPLATGILYVVIIISSMVFLNEKVTAVQAIGTLFVLIGIIALNFR